MPRDTDKHNASSRGRNGRPGGKSRSGAARGPEKKFAKRGIEGKPAGEKRPYAGKSDAPKSFGKKPYSGGSQTSFGKPYAGRREGPAPARDYGDRPKRSFSDRPRDDVRARDGGDRPFKAREDRGPRGDTRPAARSGGAKTFGEKRPYAPRGASDRPRADRPAFKPRDDRAGGDRPFKPREDRAPRGDARPARGFADKKFGAKTFGEKRSYTPRGDADRPRGDRPFKPREDRAGGDRPFKPRSDRPFAVRSDRPQGDRPFKPRGDRPHRDDARPASRGARNEFVNREAGGDRKPWQKRDEGGEARPRFSRPRQDRPDNDRPQRSAWQEHPRSERGSEERPRRDNEDDSKVFAKRPAFGGRGAYRARDPEERKPPRAPAPNKPGERIAKIVARAGMCSRRDAEAWITQGRVSVNGRVINSPALDVTSRDVVTIDGKPLPAPERTRLFLYHKPRGLMTTHADPEGRPTVFDNLPEGLPRLISIGRLDFNTEGLLLLTNDGGLARALELPDTGWLRRYRVRAHGEVTQGQLDQLRDGVEVEGVKYGPIDAKLERDVGANVWLVFAIREGKNREVRNVLAHLGLEVNRLIRVSYGPFQLGELEEGMVEEVKTRVLREQLGEKIASASNGNFAAVAESKGDVADDPVVRKKPAIKRSTVEDRKGRRVSVQRTGSEAQRARNEDEANGYGPPRRPKRGYHGKRDLAPRGE